MEEGLDEVDYTEPEGDLLTAFKRMGRKVGQHIPGGGWTPSEPEKVTGGIPSGKRKWGGIRNISGGELGDGMSRKFPNPPPLNDIQYPRLETVGSTCKGKGKKPIGEEPGGDTSAEKVNVCGDGMDKEHFSGPRAAHAAAEGHTKEKIVEEGEPGVGNPNVEGASQQGFFGKKRAQKARAKVKCVRLGEKPANLVLGGDIDMDQVEYLSTHMIVARARGRRFSIPFLRRWAKTNWGGHIATEPDIHILARGWMTFTFGSKEEADWIFGKQWEIGRTPVGMKRWTPLFDAQREKVENEPIWIRLPGLPMIFWKPARLKAIGDHLGKFIVEDMHYKISKKMTVARILVRMDFRKGFPAEMGIETEWGFVNQKLDYEGIPFKCHRCHTYGHVVAECTMIPRYIHIEDLEEDLVASPQANPKREQETAPVEKAEEHPGGEVEPSGAVGLVSSGEGLPATLGPVLVSSPRPQEPTPERTSTTGQFSGVAGGLPGKDLVSEGPALISSSPVIEVIEGKSNFTPPASCIVSSSLIDANVNIGTGRLSSLIIPRGEHVTCPVSLTPWTESPSRIATVTSSLGKGGDSHEESLIRYSLRSREVLHSGCVHSGGLGSIPGISGRGKGRGRKSDLSKAQLRASLDIAAGRQSTLDWALRAQKSPGVPS